MRKSATYESVDFASTASRVHVYGMIDDEDLFGSVVLLCMVVFFGLSLIRTCVRELPLPVSSRAAFW